MSYGKWFYSYGKWFYECKNMSFTAALQPP